jgi:hypothetical protein
MCNNAYNNIGIINLSSHRDQIAASTASNTYVRNHAYSTHSGFRSTLRNTSTCQFDKQPGNLRFSYGSFTCVVIFEHVRAMWVFAVRHLKMIRIAALLGCVHMYLGTVHPESCVSAAAPPGFLSLTSQVFSQ